MYPNENLYLDFVNSLKSILSKIKHNSDEIISWWRTTIISCFLLSFTLGLVLTYFYGPNVLFIFILLGYLLGYSFSYVFFTNMVNTLNLNDKRFFYVEYGNFSIIALTHPYTKIKSFVRSWITFFASSILGLLLGFFVIIPFLYLSSLSSLDSFLRLAYLLVMTFLAISAIISFYKGRISILLYDFLEKISEIITSLESGLYMVL